MSVYVVTSTVFTFLLIWRQIRFYIRKQLVLQYGLKYFHIKPCRLSQRLSRIVCWDRRPFLPQVKLDSFTGFSLMDAVAKTAQNLTSSEIQCKSLYFVAIMYLQLLFLGKTVSSFLYFLPFINVKAYWALLLLDVVKKGNLSIGFKA